MNTSFGITFDKRRSRQDPVLEIHFLLMMLPSLIFFPIVLESASSADTISTAKSLTDGETLVSSGKTFELGFFSPGKSTYRYLGIWYKITPNSVVWVANRNNPLTDLDGELTISKNGNLVLLNRTRTVIWSSNVSGVIPSDPVALLLDSGNLVLTNSDSMMGTEHYLWQSFDYPSDTILAGMKHGWDLNTGHERYLVSWKSVDDPSPGNFTYRMDISHGLPEFVLVMGSTRKLYRSGTWNGMRFTGQIVPMDNVFKNIIVINENESYYMFEPIVDSVVTRLTLKQSGQPHRLILQHGNTEWSIMYSVPYEQCDEYGHCGANAICRINGNPICACLEGFTPVSQEEWQVLNWSRGCKNITPWDCQKEEGFVKVPGVKLPDLLEFKLNKSMSLKECKRECLNNCSCKAFANSDISNGGSGCLMWFGNLIDVRELRVKGSEQDMYLRLSASKMKLILDASKKKRQMIILVVSTFLGVFFLVLVLCCLWFWKSRRMIEGNNEDENIDVPLFSFATIATATNNFSEAQLIGAGGFGPVYKGNLLTGQEVAVKRLSKNSGQGLKEFKNEVELIAKLQHRNLVALLGCCIQGEERMLIYEYMPNKSLDRFIFDYKRRITLPWKKHFDIVKGIARGLLYLQRDSKLHIVHRDLKASNILLDDNLNPKIADFGLARIFGDDEKEARTRRVIGTFGYMSPEYAIDGKFSVKSDIFSFGVLLLEIVSGKRNRSFHHPNHHHNLLGHAWLLWSEGKALDLMDVCFKDSYVESQVLRCIHIALLCIQKFPHDRPTMSYVVFMLENEEALPSDRPRQPGFFVERADSTSEGSMSRSEEFNSENMLTITVPNVR